MAKNVSDPRVVRALAESLRADLGAERVAEAVRQIEANSESAPPLDILRGFVLLDQWLEALTTSKMPPQIELMLKFCSVASVVSEASKLPSAQPWMEDIARKAFHSDPELFYEALFEGEFAQYWVEQVSRRPSSVEFGPPSQHPDVWLSMQSPTPMRLPAECKRIRPHGEKELSLGRTAEAIDAEFQNLIGKYFPLKVTVWFHRPVRDGDVKSVMGMLTNLVKTMSADDPWHTGFDSEGGYQVSAAPLGPAGEFQPPMVSVSDVDATPILIPRLVIKQTATGPLVRVRSLLSVRSDVTRDRVGNLRRNVGKAIQQLLRTASMAAPGVVVIRIRPPMDEGDLLESDREIRAELGRNDSRHVSLAAVFWNDGDRIANPIEAGGRPATEHQVSYSLKPYFIANSRAPVQLGLDSYESHFGDLDRPVVRDPADGALKPVDPDTMAVLRDGGPLPPMLADAFRKMDVLDERQGSATAYVELADTLARVETSAMVSLLKAGRRQFRSFLDRGRLLRTFEIRDGLPVRSCTIDLRAWSDARELCWVAAWSEEDFVVRIWSPDEKELHTAGSARVKQFEEPRGPSEERKMSVLPKFLWLLGGVLTLLLVLRFLW